MIPPAKAAVPARVTLSASVTRASARSGSLDSAAVRSMVRASPRGGPVPTGVRWVIQRVRSFGLPAAMAVMVAVPVRGQEPADLIFADGFDDHCGAANGEGTACDGPDSDGCAEGTRVCVGGVLECSDATSDSNHVVDGSFEGGFMGGFWTESSTNFGSPICSIDDCGWGSGGGPHTGAYWAWLGGTEDAETAYVTQSLVIPIGTATLTFWLEVSICDTTGGTDTFSVLLDGATIFSTDNVDPACNLIGYVQKSVDVSGYADGGSHALEFRGEFPFAGTGVTNFMVDDIRLESCP